MQFAGAVEVNDWNERSRMSIKEKFDQSLIAGACFAAVVVVVAIARFHSVVIAQFHQILHAAAARQAAESRLGNALEGGPRELVPLATDVDDHTRRRTCCPARSQRRHGRQTTGTCSSHRGAVMMGRWRETHGHHRAMWGWRWWHAIHDDRRVGRQRRRRSHRQTELLGHFLSTLCPSASSSSLSLSTFCQPLTSSCVTFLH